MNDQLEIARGAGNVSDLGAPGVAADSLKAMLADRIAAALDRQKLSVRAAEQKTGLAAADFSRIRQKKLGRFTVERLLGVLGRLDPAIELSLIVRPNLTRDWVLRRLKAHEAEIRTKGATSLYLFGSVARNEAGHESDVDIFVEYEPGSRFTLIELAGIKILLEEDIGVPVHITTRDSLKPPLEDEIEPEAIKVF